MLLWRVSNYADLSGVGGKYAAGRWNHLGTPIIYCADHPALALLETLVHFDPEDMPEDYQLIGIDAPDDIGIEDAFLPANWKDDRKATRDAFETFRTRGAAALLRAPSVIVPHCHNFLVDPGHHDAARLRIVSAERHPLDRRFAR